MAIIFHPPREAIDFVMERLKSARLVHPDAVFNPSAPDGLRREVTYRDYDFVRRLGKAPAEVGIVEAALALLKGEGFVPSSACYDAQAFEGFRQEVKDNFEGPWTTITPTMERLIYALTAVKRPKCLVELGCFWGNTLAWFAGPCIGSHQVYQAEHVYGVDLDGEAIEKARANFSKLPNCKAVGFIAEEARVALERIKASIDFLYLEARDPSPDAPKDQTLAMLKAAYDKLPKGAWVICHDTTDPWWWERDMATYLPWVRDRAHFAESVCFDIDECGLELSIK